MGALRWEEGWWGANWWDKGPGEWPTLVWELLCALAVVLLVGCAVHIWKQCSGAFCHGIAGRSSYLAWPSALHPWHSGNTDRVRPWRSQGPTFPLPQCSALSTADCQWLNTQNHKDFPAFLVSLPRGSLERPSPWSLGLLQPRPAWFSSAGPEAARQPPGWEDPSPPSNLVRAPEISQPPSPSMSKKNLFKNSHSF